jgi:hypothetical protein
MGILLLLKQLQQTGTGNKLNKMNLTKAVQALLK